MTTTKKAKSDAFDLGSYEMGFNPATTHSRERDKLDVMTLAPGDVLRTMHDHQMPRTTLPTHQFSKPSRHAPWKSDAERVMLGSEVSMGRHMARSFKSSADGSDSNASRSGGGGSRSSQQIMPFTSPVRVGRPGTSDNQMQNRSLYSRVANSVDRSSIPRIDDEMRSLNSSMSSTSTMPKPAQSPQIKHLTGKGDGPETRSPYARFDLIPQNFTNPVVQDLWNEVSNTNVGSSQERDTSFLVEEGLPRRLPSNVSSLESSAPLTSPSDPNRFSGVKQDAEKLWANREGRAKVSMPDGYHPTYSSTERFKLEQPLFDATGLQRPATSLTTYNASYGLNHFTCKNSEFDGEEDNEEDNNSLNSTRKSYNLSRHSGNTERDIFYHLEEEKQASGNNGVGINHFSSIGDLAMGASAAQPFDKDDMDKHYKTHHEPKSVSRSNNMRSPNQSHHQRASSSPSSNTMRPITSTTTTSTSSSLITRREFSPSFGMRSSILNDFFSGPRASVNGSEVRRNGSNIPHSHSSVDAKFHAEKFFQVRHADPDYDRLRNAGHFYRITPSNAKIGPPLATNGSN